LLAHTYFCPLPPALTAIWNDTSSERLLPSKLEDFDRVDRVRARVDVIFIGSTAMRRDHQRHPRRQIPAHAEGVRRATRLATFEGCTLSRVVRAAAGSVVQAMHRDSMRRMGGGREPEQAEFVQMVIDRRWRPSSCSRSVPFRGWSDRQGGAEREHRGQAATACKACITHALIENGSDHEPARRAGAADR
jgi:hypothetical protein